MSDEKDARSDKEDFLASDLDQLESAEQEVLNEHQNYSVSGPHTQGDKDEERDWPCGWRPWTCMLACFFLMFNSWGLVNAYGTFGSYYLQHLLAPTNAVKVNLIGALECAVVLGLSGVAGRVLDAGYARTCIATGTVLVPLGMFLLGVVNAGDDGRGGGSYALTVLTQGLLMPLGMACFFVASSQIVATWFRRRRSIAVGLVACGASIAGLVYPIMTKFLLEKLGFRDVLFCDAGLALVTSLFALAFATPNPRHKVNKPDAWLVRETWIDMHAFHSPAFWWLTAAIAFLFFGFYAVFFNIEEWAAHEGFGKKDRVPGAFDQVTTPQHGSEVAEDAIRTFYLLAITNVSSSLGRVGGGAAGERFGAVRTHAAATFAASLACAILWPLVSNVNGAIAFSVLFGAASGAVIGMPPASMMAVLQRDSRADQRRAGQWVGAMYTFAAVPALAGPVIAGSLIQATRAYAGLQAWSAACLFLSAVCMAAADAVAERDARRSLRQAFKESWSSLTSWRRRSLRPTSADTVAPVSPVEKGSPMTSS